MTIVVLAAGMSSRMGGGLQKLTMDFRGRPLVSYAVGAAVANSDTLLVTGFKSDEVTSAAEKFAAGMKAAGCAYGLRCVFNPDYEFGQLSSVICGMRHAPAGDIAFMTGDSPFVTAGFVAKALDRFHASDCDVLRTYCGSCPAHPVIVRACARDAVYRVASELEAAFRLGGMSAEPNLRDAFASLSALRVGKFEADDSNVAADLDTLADFKTFGA